MQSIVSRTAAAAVLIFSFAAPAQSAPLSGLMPIDTGASLVHQVDGCHAYFDYHYIPRLNRRAEHRHRGNSCVPVVVESGSSSGTHCHANAQGHTHRGYGRTVHRHRSNSCSVKVLDRTTGGTAGRTCFTVGPFTYCE